jgi:hypothetical protein
MILAVILFFLSILLSGGKNKFFAILILTALVAFLIFYFSDQLENFLPVDDKESIRGYVSYPKRGKIVTLSDLEKKKIFLTSDKPETIPQVVRLSSSKITGDVSPGTYSAEVNGTGRTVTLIVV